MEVSSTHKDYPLRMEVLYTHKYYLLRTKINNALCTQILKPKTKLYCFMLVLHEVKRSHIKFHEEKKLYFVYITHAKMFSKNVKIMHMCVYVCIQLDRYNYSHTKLYYKYYTKFICLLNVLFEIVYRYNDKNILHHLNMLLDCTIHMMSKIIFNQTEESFLSTYMIRSLTCPTKQKCTELYLSDQPYVIYMVYVYCFKKTNFIMQTIFFRTYIKYIDNVYRHTIYIYDDIYYRVKVIARPEIIKYFMYKTTPKILMIYENV